MHMLTYFLLALALSAASNYLKNIPKNFLESVNPRTSEMACKGKGPNVSGGFVNSFIALYCGENIGVARVIAVSASPELVREFASRMLDDASSAEDLILRSVDDGRRRALQLVRDEGGTSGI